MQNETVTTDVRRATTNSKDDIDASVNSTMYKLFYYILALLCAFRPGSKDSFKEAFGIPNLMENHMETKHKSEFLDDGRKRPKLVLDSQKNELCRNSAEARQRVDTQSTESNWKRRKSQ